MANLVKSEDPGDSASRQEAETLTVPWADHSEVAVVQRDDDLRPQALGQGDHRGIGPSQGQIGVLLNELSDPRPVSSEGRLDIEAFEPPQEASLGHGAPVAVNQVGGFGYAKSGYHETKTRTLQGSQAGAVCRVGAIRHRDQRAAIHDRE